MTKIKIRTFPLTEEQIQEIETKCTVEQLRDIRRAVCFAVVDRPLWLNTLSEEQMQELTNWYVAWLNVTETMVQPQKPSWLP